MQMTMDSPNLAADRDFLFVIEIKNGDFYQDQSELIKFLQVLPESVRVYAVIHAGMNTIKVYCITKSLVDYASVSDLTGSKTEIIDRKNITGNASGMN
jgi:hypothetical protein